VPAKTGSAFDRKSSKHDKNDAARVEKSSLSTETQNKNAAGRSFIL
jgi:hypothetical protein